MIHLFIKYAMPLILIIATVLLIRNEKLVHKDDRKIYYVYFASVSVLVYCMIEVAML